MRLGCLGLTTVFCLLGSLTPSSAQPTEFFTCVSSQDPGCGSSSTVIADGCAGRFFTIYEGRAAWFPIRYETPVTIEVEGRAGYAAQLPVYVEIVPLSTPPPPSFCFEGHPGYAVGIFHGGGLYCGGGWERFGPVPLDVYVSPGGLYALQLTWFTTHDNMMSPGIDCIRVSTSAGRPSAVVERSWGNAKALYR